ncbi:hypothetical protein HN451_11150, partial [archaeon]|nr:hypothetical protein [archaeon]
MIKPKNMVKLSVFGPKSYMKKVIETMYNMNVVHIDDHTKKSEEDFFDIGAPFKENEQFADTLVKIRSIISNLNINKGIVKKSATSIPVIDKKTQEVYEKVNYLLKKQEYFSQIKKLYDKTEIQKSLNSLKIDIDDNVDYSNFTHYVGYIDQDSDLLKEQIEKITKKYIMHSVNYQGLTLVGLFVDKKKKDKIKDLLKESDFSPIDNPVVKEKYDLKSSAGIKFVKLNKELETVTNDLKKVENRIQEVKDEHTTFLLESEKLLSIESEKAEAPLRFASTKNTFLVKGWVPKKNSKKLEKEIKNVTNKKVHIEFHGPVKGDNVPIAFNHPKIVEPFEAFMNLYSLPSYKEIDPTFFMFLTFPLFFGFMLGDVGYGIVIFALFSMLKKKMPGAKNFLNTFIIAAVVSIVFGMVFGEYFGYEAFSQTVGERLQLTTQPWVLETFHMHPFESHGHTVFPFPHIFARSHNINDLLSLAILFGIVHVLIGYIIGFVNILKAHGLKMAIL